MEKYPKLDSTKMERGKVSASPIMKMVRKSELVILYKESQQAFGCTGIKKGIMIG